MTPSVTACAGFLAAVLWFDLMHDVQVIGRGAVLPDAVRSSIAGYYRRVTLDARPMSHLVGAVMLTTVGTIAAQLAQGDTPRWVPTTCLCLAVSATALAVVRTVRNARRLGLESAADVQSRLARSVFADHVFCLSAISLVLALELIFGR